MSQAALRKIDRWHCACADDEARRGNVQSGLEALEQLPPIWTRLGGAARAKRENEAQRKNEAQRRNEVRKKFHYVLLKLKARPAYQELVKKQEQKK